MTDSSVPSLALASLASSSSSSFHECSSSSLLTTKFDYVLIDDNFTTERASNENTTYVTSTSLPDTHVAHDAHLLRDQTIDDDVDGENTGAATTHHLSSSAHSSLLTHIENVSLIDLPFVVVSEISAVVGIKHIVIVAVTRKTFLPSCYRAFWPSPNDGHTSCALALSYFTTWPKAQDTCS
jgi:hypothetical protein